MRLRFTKMHGLGNDFFLYERAADEPLPTVAQWRWLADRHRGVGFDQAVIFEAARSPEAIASYRIFNADGGEAEQSGNGARCAIRLLHINGRSRGGEVVIDTARGLTRGRVLDDGRVTVNMGAPDFRPGSLPFTVERQAVNYELTLDGEHVEFSAVSMGNPHVVLRVEAIESAPVERLGRALQADARFPHQVNVGFVQIVDAAQVKLRVYERGAGETLACGTGSCAAVAHGRQLGLLGPDVEVHVRGGLLSVNWAGGETPMWLTGPAEIAYTGQVELNGESNG